MNSFLHRVITDLEKIVARLREENASLRKSCELLADQRNAALRALDESRLDGR